MKYFHFDESIYKKLNENIFDDDIINDSDYNISNKLMDKEEVLKIFNILYEESTKLVGRKYGCMKPCTFGNIKEIEFNGSNYYVIDMLKEPAMYVTLPKLKRYAGPVTIIASQALVDFMENNNILVHTPVACINNSDVWNYKTYIYENVTLSKPYIENMSIIGKLGIREFSYIYFNNVKLDKNAFEEYLNLPNKIVNIQQIFCNNGIGISDLNIHISTPLELTIQNDKTLKNFSAVYENKTNNYNGKIVLQNCPNLTNVNIQDKSSFITLCKLKIDKCPNIDTKTLMLPNHNTKSFNIQLFNDISLLKSISYRGDVITWFYFNSPYKNYKYKYYNSKPYLSLYKKKGE